MSSADLNPHNWLSRRGKPPIDKWTCQYCKMTGTHDDLRATACTYVYPPCPSCGQTPLCAPLCDGVIKALTDPWVVVLGGPKERGIQ